MCLYDDLYAGGRYDMEIHQLKYFLAVAEWKSFSRAALELNIAQSSLSIQIGKLESELNVQLFERSARSLSLTPAALELLPLAARVIRDVDSIGEAVSSFISADKGQLRVGAFPGSRYFGFIDTISSFKKENPDVNLLLTEAECKYLAGALENAEIDVAFFSQIDHIPSVRNHLLYRDYLVFAVPEGHRCADAGVIPLEALAEEPLIVNAGSMIYDDIIGALWDIGLKPNVSVRTERISTQLGFVASGMGGALISHMTSGSYDNMGLAYLKTEPQVHRNIYMGVLQQHTKWPVVKKFMEFVLERHAPVE